MSGVRPLAAGRLLRAGSLLTVLTLATGFLGYAFQVLMGRVLFRDDFVVLNALMAVVMVLCSPLASLGLVLTRQVALVRASGDGGRVRILYRAASGRLLLACVAGLAAIFVGSPVVRQYLRIRDDESFWWARLSSFSTTPSFKGCNASPGLAAWELGPWSSKQVSVSFLRRSSVGD